MSSSVQLFPPHLSFFYLLLIHELTGHVGSVLYAEVPLLDMGNLLQ